MASRVGVTFEQPDPTVDRFILRWRERRPEGWEETHPKSKGWRSVEMPFQGTVYDRDKLIAEIRRSLAESGTFDRARGVEKVVPVPPANLLKGMLTCIDERAQTRVYRSEGTANTYRSYARRLAARIHQVERIPKERPLPVTVLCRTLFAKLVRTEVDAETADGGRAALRFLLDAWRWMAAEPSRWPHVPPAPASTKDYLPEAPAYARTVAPSMAHVDAMLRHLKANPLADPSTLIAAVLMRYTGARAEEVFGLDFADLDLVKKLVHLRGTKTKAADRFVPIPEALLAEPGIRAWLTRSTSGPVFPHAKDPTRSRPRGAPETFRAAWEAATAHDKVPRAVWDPTVTGARKISRPQHALRAGLQAFLTDEGVPKDAIDVMVGHAGDLREVHYGRELRDKLHEAAKRIPAVDWVGPREQPDNVVELASARR